MSGTSQSSGIFGGFQFRSGTTVKYAPVTGTDTVPRNGVSTNIQTRIEVISTMKEYENKSLEELRVEDYLAKRGVPGKGSGLFFFGPTLTAQSFVPGQGSGIVVFRPTLTPQRVVPGQGSVLGALSHTFTKQPTSDLECELCREYFDDANHRPKNLPCGHTFCLKCMSKEISKRRKMCPICRKPHRAKSVTDLPMNVVVERLIRNMPKKLSLDTISSESGNEGDDYSGGTCSTHWKSAIYFFCETHSLHICRDCTVIEHQVTKCKIVSIKEKIEIRKEDIIHQVNSAITAINDNISTINEYVKEKYKIISHQKIKIQHSKQIIEDATNTIAMEKAAIGKAQNEILKRNLKMLKMETLKFNLKKSKNMKTINDIAKSIEDVSLQYETLHKTNTNSPEVPMMKSEEWTCTTCMVINKNTKENCVICETPKPGPST